MHVCTFLTGIPHTIPCIPEYYLSLSLSCCLPVLQKPQMLEMYNVDPSVLTQSPTRLILKLGDDLRQDMITLRMFSLFEKVLEGMNYA